MSTPTAPHVVVVDAPLRRAMAREIWWHDLRVLRGRALTTAGVGYVVGAVVADGRLAVATAALAVLLLAGWQWARVHRVVTARLPLGQTVSVSVSGETLATQPSSRGTARCPSRLPDRLPTSGVRSW